MTKANSWLFRKLNRISFARGALKITWDECDRQMVAALRRYHRRMFKATGLPWYRCRITQPVPGFRRARMAAR